MIKIYKLIIFTVAAISLLGLSSICLSQNEKMISNDIFIIKNYSQIVPSPYPGSPNCKEYSFEVFEIPNLLEINYNRYCYMSYPFQVEGEYYFSKQVFIRIISHRDKSRIISDILLSREIGLERKQNIQIINKSILILDTSRREDLPSGYYLWISGNNHIDIHYNDIEIPKEMLQDYLEKYPPTQNIDMSDLELTNIFKPQIKGAYDLLLKYDENRGFYDRHFNKMETLAVIRNQCYVEYAIRSWTGMDENGKQKGCPITLIEDQADRRAAYKKLKESALRREIKKEYILMNAPETPRGAVFDEHNDMKRAKEMLGITQDDMNKEWERQMKEIEKGEKEK